MVGVEIKRPIEKFFLFIVYDNLGKERKVSESILSLREIQSQNIIQTNIISCMLVYKYDEHRVGMNIAYFDIPFYSP